MLRTTIAGSLPKPSWLADPGAQLFAPWVAPADRLHEAQDDAVRLSLLDQEEAGIDIVSDGEQRRRHYIWGFLDGLIGTDTARLGKKRTRGGKYDERHDQHADGRAPHVRPWRQRHLPGVRRGRIAQP